MPQAVQYWKWNLSKARRQFADMSVHGKVQYATAAREVAVGQMCKARPAHDPWMEHCKPDLVHCTPVLRVCVTWLFLGTFSCGSVRIVERQHDCPSLTPISDAADSQTPHKHCLYYTAHCLPYSIAQSTMLQSTAKSLTWKHSAVSEILDPLHWKNANSSCTILQLQLGPRHFQ